MGFNNNELCMIIQALVVYHNLQKEILYKQIEERGSKAPFVNELTYVECIEDLLQKVSKYELSKGEINEC